MRIARLVERGVSTRSILAMTFTNKAAAEMKERVAHLVGAQQAKDLWVSTFHSFGMRVIRSDPRAFGLSSDHFAIFDQGDTTGAIREILRTIPSARRYDVGGIQARLSHAKNQLFDDDELPEREGDEYDEIARLVWPRYRAALRAFHAFDFDDLVCAPVWMWKRRADVLERWQTRFRYLLIDEYQDTNRAQLEMVRLLAAAHRNVMVVGDDDQSIYAWRGADVSNILDFERHFPGAKIVKLEHNYRSTAPVLAVANAVLARTAARRHEKVLRPTRVEGVPVELVVAPDPDTEAAFIADQIATLREEGVPLEEMAVLYRGNQQSEPIESALKERQVPFRVIGGTQFYERKEIKDLLAYLRIALNARDEICVRRVLNYPARHIGDTSVERLEAAGLARGLPLFEMIQRAESIEDLTPQAKTGCREFADVVQATREAIERGQPAADVARDVVERIHLREDVFAGSGTSAQAARRWGNVEALFNVLRRHDERHPHGDRRKLSDLIQFLTVSAESEDKTDPHVVTLTTMHGAKGLEYRCVFIAGVEEGLLPHSRTFEARATDVGAAGENDVEEERRLFYVSITRARDRLWLCRTEYRATRGKTQKRAPSRFLGDIPPELLRVRTVTGAAPAATNAAARGAALLSALDRLGGPPAARPRK